MAQVFVGVGSNIEPESNILCAAALLKQQVNVCAVSPFYLTDPIGPPGSGPFYNGCLEIETDIPPRKLKFEVLRPIETALGRRRTEDKYAPRTIDLDILLYDDRVIEEPDLKIPDPDITRRPFVAIPLLELAPELAMPDTGTKLAEIVLDLPGASMRLIPNFTSRLWQEVTNGSEQN